MNLITNYLFSFTWLLKYRTMHLGKLPLIIDLVLPGCELVMIFVYGCDGNFLFPKLAHVHWHNFKIDFFSLVSVFNWWGCQIFTLNLKVQVSIIYHPICIHMPPHSLCASKFSCGISCFVTDAGCSVTYYISLFCNCRLCLFSKWHLKWKCAIDLNTARALHVLCQTSF